tara:strand:- start:189 stop:431 length:243 start_codon:yes stop_codon:yes gene_type:complete
MKTKTFKVTIRVEPQTLADKYPNFIRNYENEQEFVRNWVKRTKSDGFAKDGGAELTLENWGYDISIITDYEAENTLDQNL